MYAFNIEHPHANFEESYFVQIIHTVPAPKLCK